MKQILDGEEAWRFICVPSLRQPLANRPCGSSINHEIAKHLSSSEVLGKAISPASHIRLIKSHVKAGFVRKWPECLQSLMQMFVASVTQKYTKNCNKSAKDEKRESTANLPEGTSCKCCDCQTVGFEYRCFEPFGVKENRNGVTGPLRS